MVSKGRYFNKLLFNLILLLDCYSIMFFNNYFKDKLFINYFSSSILLIISIIKNYKVISIEFS